MKSILACVVLVAVFAKLQAYPADSSYNYEEGIKKAADIMVEMTKKMEETTGIHSEFDKEKFFKACKGLLEKIQEAQTKLKDAIDSNFKNVPGTEEMKKKYEEIQKQIGEFQKSLSSAEAQKSMDKFRETWIASSKKVSDSLIEVATKFGVAPPPAIQKSISEMSEEFHKSLKVFQDKFQKIVEEATNELKKKKA